MDNVTKDVSWAANQHIRFWFLKDHVTEDLCNDAKNLALPFTGINYISKSIKIENFYINCSNISLYYCVYCIFCQINAALVYTVKPKIIQTLDIIFDIYFY